MLRQAAPLRLMNEIVKTIERPSQTPIRQYTCKAGHGQQKHQHQNKDGDDDLNQRKRRGGSHRGNLLLGRQFTMPWSYSRCARNGRFGFHSVHLVMSTTAETSLIADTEDLRTEDKEGTNFYRLRGLRRRIHESVIGDP